MGRMKRFAMQVSEELGYDGELNEHVLKVAGKKLKDDAERERIIKKMDQPALSSCEGCGELTSNDSFLCDACEMSMHLAYEDCDVEFTAEELDNMADAYYQQKDAEALVDPEHPEHGKAKI